MYLSKAGKPEVLQMGCYGIGVTRLLAACIEHFSNEKEIRWPQALAPFKVCIIPPKEGSKEEKLVKHLCEEVYCSLNAHESLHDEIVIDDRLILTIGARLKDVRKLGFPFIIVIGSKATEAEPQIEVHQVNEGLCSYMTISDAVNLITTYVQSCSDPTAIET